MPSKIKPFQFRSAELRQELEKQGYNPDELAKLITEAIAPQLLEGKTLEEIEDTLTRKEGE